MDSNEIIVNNITNQERIEQILLYFENDKTIPLKLRKSRFADQLVDLEKSDLEIVKSNLEYNIDIGRIFAAILVLASAFLLGWLTLWRLDLKWLALMKFVTLGGLILLGFITYKIIGRQLACLHVVKIALAKKSDIKNEETPD